MAGIRCCLPLQMPLPVSNPSLYSNIYFLNQSFNNLFHKLRYAHVCVCVCVCVCACAWVNMHLYGFSSMFWQLTWSYYSVVIGQTICQWYFGSSEKILHILPAQVYDTNCVCVCALHEVRQIWRRRRRKGGREGKESSLPSCNNLGSSSETERVPRWERERAGGGVGMGGSLPLCSSLWSCGEWEQKRKWDGKGGLGEGGRRVAGYLMLS